MRYSFFFLLLFSLSFVAALTIPANVQKVIDYQNSMSLNVTFLITFVIGFLSFTSPCGFVLIPAFFSYAFKERKKAFWMSLVFSSGMILAFSIVGLIAGMMRDIFNFSLVMNQFLIPRKKSTRRIVQCDICFLKLELTNHRHTCP